MGLSEPPLINTGARGPLGTSSDTSPKGMTQPQLGDWLPWDSWEAACIVLRQGHLSPALGGHLFLGGLTKSHLPSPHLGQSTGIRCGEWWRLGHT